MNFNKPLVLLKKHNFLKSIDDFSRKSTSKECYYKFIVERFNQEKDPYVCYSAFVSLVNSNKYLEIEYLYMCIRDQNIEKFILEKCVHLFDIQKAFKICKLQYTRKMALLLSKMPEYQELKCIDCNEPMYNDGCYPVCTVCSRK